MKFGAERFTSSNSVEGVYDPGPPPRVAFVIDGILDNWYGFVHDPSGLVLQANRFRNDWSNWNDPALAPVKGLFGGDLRAAMHLWDDWYVCWFT